MNVFPVCHQMALQITIKIMPITNSEHFQHFHVGPRSRESSTDQRLPYYNTWLLRFDHVNSTETKRTNSSNFSTLLTSEPKHACSSTDQYCTIANTWIYWCLKTQPCKSLLMWAQSTWRIQKINDYLIRNTCDNWGLSARPPKTKRPCLGLTTRNP